VLSNPEKRQVLPISTGAEGLKAGAGGRFGGFGDIFGGGFGAPECG